MTNCLQPIHYNNDLQIVKTEFQGVEILLKLKKDMDAVTSEKLLIATPPYQNA